MNNEIKKGQIWMYETDVRKLDHGEKVYRKSFPVLVLQNNLGNKYSNKTMVARICKGCMKYADVVHQEIELFGESHFILLDDIVTINQDKLVEMMYELDEM